MNWQFMNLSLFEQCQNSVDFSTEYLNKEGCRFRGRLKVNKVGGAFHIAPGVTYTKNNGHMHDLKVLGHTQVSN